MLSLDAHVRCFAPSRCRSASHRTLACSLQDEDIQPDVHASTHKLAPSPSPAHAATGPITDPLIELTGPLPRRVAARRSE